MTQAELDALPEIGPSIVLWVPSAADPIMVKDFAGVKWFVGYHNGVRYKQRKKPLYRLLERGGQVIPVLDDGDAGGYVNVGGFPAAVESAIAEAKPDPEPFSGGGGESGGGGATESWSEDSSTSTTETETP